MNEHPSSVRAPRRPMSLAEFARGLGVGSSCFCCGGDMRSVAVTGSMSMGCGGDLAAVCPACGGEFGALQGDADAGPSDLEARNRLGAAA